MKIRKHKVQPKWEDFEPQKTSRFEIMTRYEWGALKPLNTKTLLLPVQYVRFLMTGTKSCRKERECNLLVRGLQKEAMEVDKKDDIPYNFLVSDSGHIYYGRGWWVEADRDPKYSYLEGNCFDIAYIGNFDPDSKYKSRRGPTETAEVAVKKFLEYCVDCRVLIDDYKVLPFEESLPPKEVPEEKGEDDEENYEEED